MVENPINTALLSYGMSGEVFHGPLLTANPGFKIVSVYQRDKSKSPKHNHPVVFSADQIFNNPAVELVIVNTPNDSHHAFARQALEAGKHVIVEKPFTVTTEEANDLIVLAQKRKLLLTVFQNRRWDGDFLTVRKVVDNGLVGKIVEFEAHYDRFRNYIEANTWKEEPARGTGILYNLGSHMLDQVVALFGLPEFVDARMGIQRPGGKVDDFYDIRLTYADKQCIVKSSYLVREQGPRYQLHGTDGSFVKYGLDPQEQALKEKKIPGAAGWGAEDASWWGKLNRVSGGLSFEGKVETVSGNYPAFYANVYAAIRLGQPLAVKPEESRDVIRIIEACAQSNSTRSAVRLTH